MGGLGRPFFLATILQDLCLWLDLPCSERFRWSRAGANGNHHTIIWSRCSINSGASALSLATLVAPCRAYELRGRVFLAGAAPQRPAPTLTHWWTPQGRELGTFTPSLASWRSTKRGWLPIAAACLPALLPMHLVTADPKPNSPRQSAEQRKSECTKKHQSRAQRGHESYQVDAIGLSS